jgi:hypothetical protein
MVCDDLFHWNVAGLVAMHGYHAVINQDGIARIQKAVRLVVHRQGFGMNQHVRITARSKTVVIS